VPNFLVELFLKWFSLAKWVALCGESYNFKTSQNKNQLLENPALFHHLFGSQIGGCSLIVRRNVS
jgi:hypothetical protein